MADAKISALPAAGSLTGTELVPIVQSGTTDRTTTQAIANLATGTGTVTSVSVTTANGVSGSVATATTTPAITLTLGAITPTTVNGITFTTSSGTFTLANSKTLTISNTMTFTATDGSTIAFGAGGMVMYNPMTTGGDVIYGGASGLPTRLANGTVGQVLTSGGTTVAPTWTTIAGTGTVTHTGALTANALILGNAADDIKPMASLGTTTTVLHGNAAGAPTFGAVDLATDVTGNIPVPTNAQTGTSYTVLSTDQGKLVTQTNSSAVATTLPQATGPFTTGWSSTTLNLGSGLVTVTPTTSTVNGHSSIVLAKEQWMIEVSDGANYGALLGGLTSNALRSATTIVDVSAATAPSSGQVLTATSGTAATWQTVTGTGTVTTVSVVTANGVSGSVANATTTPAITLTLGAITPTTVNGNTITTGTGVLTLAASKTLTASNTITLTGTDGVSMNVSNNKLRELVFCIGDGTNAISANATSFFVPCVFAGSITAYTISADQGTCTIKTWKKATGTARPTISDVISTSGVSLSTGTLVRSATVSDFTSTTVTANDGFIVQVTAVAGGATQISFILEITAT